MSTTEASGPAESPVQKSGVVQRVGYTVGPIVGGVILDAADLITFGPYGLYCGFVVGAFAGWWLAAVYKFTLPFKVFWAVVTGLYCTVPMTELFPIATLVSAAHRFFHWSAE